MIGVIRGVRRLKPTPSFKKIYQTYLKQVILTSNHFGLDESVTQKNLLACHP